MDDATLDATVRRSFELSTSARSRSAVQIVELARKFDATLFLSRGGLKADADSFLQVMMLELERGSVLEAEASGPQARELMDALEALNAARFGFASF